MVSIVAWPQLASQGRDALSGILNDAPALVGSVSGDWVEEVVGVDSFETLDLFYLFFALRLAGVLPSIQGEGGVFAESLERLVACDLVEWGVLVSTFGDSAAFSLDLADSGGKPVQLSQMLWWENDAGCSVDDSGWFLRLNEDGVEFSREERLEGIELCCCVSIDSWQGREDVV